MSEASVARPARFLGFSAALLILLALLTGFFVAAAMTRRIEADFQSALAAHLNALLGAFWILGVAWSLPFLGYGPVGLNRLAWSVVIPNYANWCVTTVKAMWRVSGVDYVGHGKNDTIFGLLTVLVVLPSIASAAAWMVGFRKGALQNP
jgi:hydroxylaminobenzene mutase